MSSDKMKTIYRRESAIVRATYLNNDDTLDVLNITAKDRRHAHIIADTITLLPCVLDVQIIDSTSICMQPEITLPHALVQALEDRASIIEEHFDKERSYDIERQIDELNDDIADYVNHLYKQTKGS